MSKTAYIVMKSRSSPVAIGYTVPHEVHLVKQDAIRRADELNARAQKCTYDVCSVPFVVQAAK